MDSSRTSLTFDQRFATCRLQRAQYDNHKRTAMITTALQDPEQPGPLPLISGATEIQPRRCCG